VLARRVLRDLRGSGKEMYDVLKATYRGASRWGVKGVGDGKR